MKIVWKYLVITSIIDLKLLFNLNNQGNKMNDLLKKYYAKNSQQQVSELQKKQVRNCYIPDQKK